MTVSPVFAENDQTDYDYCAEMGQGKLKQAKEKKECFRKLAKGLLEAQAGSTTDETDVSDICTALNQDGWQEVSMRGLDTRYISDAWRAICQKSEWKGPSCG
jgi:hypothetical protein